VSYGLTAGSTTRFSSLAAHSTQAFTSCSSGVLAELSAQNASSRTPAAGGSSSSSADQASRAHTAPPEVPLRPTISIPTSSWAPTSRLSTPAVKAVWLPPPWQAMATLRGAVSVIRHTVRQRCFAPPPRGLVAQV
jgi:hypothetical protein